MEADSLPSHSVFVRHVEDDGRENVENVHVKPLKASASSPFDESPLPRSKQVSSMDRMSVARNSRDEGKKAVVKRTFLKRGSRTEPSALNRLKKEEEDAKNGIIPGGDKERKSSQSQRASVQSSVRRRPQPQQGIQVEILMPTKPPRSSVRPEASGLLRTGANEPVPVPGQEPAQRFDHVREERGDAAMYSTATAAEPGFHSEPEGVWVNEQSRALKELEEFEELEQQLEAIETHSGVSAKPTPIVRAMVFSTSHTGDEVNEPDTLGITSGRDHFDADVVGGGDTCDTENDDDNWGEGGADYGAPEASFRPSVEMPPAAVPRAVRQPIVETIATRQSSEHLDGGTPRRYVTARGTTDGASCFERVDVEDRATKAAAAATSVAVDRLRQDLAQKAEELEKELSAYKKENSAIKHLRKQQEAVLAEAMNERKLIMDWIEEEKTQTELWCKEQKAAAVRQRRSANTLYKDAKQRGFETVVPSRKERAEIEALQVTVEKVRVDHDALKKKSGLNERRMQQRIRDQADTIKLQKDQIGVMEEEKVRIWETLSKSPGGRNILKSLKNPPVSYSGAREPKQPTSAEEYYFLSEMEAAAAGAGGLATALYVDEPTDYGIVEQESSYSRGSLSDAIFEANTNLGLGRGSAAARGGPTSTSRSSLRYHSSSQEYSDIEGGEETGAKTFGGSLTLQPRADGGEEEEEDAEGTVGEAARSSDSRKRTEVVTDDGRRIVTYRNKTVKETLPDGRAIVKYTNGDTMTTDQSNGTVVYFYAQAGTTHTTLPDGTNVYEFPNKQIEEHLPDGTKHIHFPDSTKKVVYTDGTTESMFPDGVCVREDGLGDSEVVCRY